MSDEKILTFEDVEASIDTEYKTIPVPEWKGSVRIATLTAADLLEWTEANEGPAKKTAGLRLLVKSLVDSDGKRIGSDKHLQMLKQKNAMVLQRLISEVLALNGLKTKEQNALKNDSSEAPTGASLTDSPPSSGSIM